MQVKVAGCDISQCGIFHRGMAGCKLCSRGVKIRESWQIICTMRVHNTASYASKTLFNSGL